MKTNVEKTDPLHRTISIELPWDMIAEELDREYDELRKKVNLKGFRQGKVPRGVLKQRFGAQVHSDVAGRMIQEAYEAALIQNGIQPVAMPDLEPGEFKEGQPFSFVAKVEVQPEVELKKTEGFEIAVEPVEVSAEMIAEEIERLRDARSVLVPIEDRKVAQSGDVAIIDYQASSEGEALEGGQKDDHEVHLGAGMTVPGFDDAIIGLSVGEQKEFDLTYPEEDLPEKLAGKQISFQVTLKALKAKEQPLLDDDFAKDLGEEGVETADQVREMVERRLREGLEASRKKETRGKLLDQLLEANPFPVPPALVQRQKEGMLMEVQSMLQFQGMNPDQIASRREKILEDLAPRAEREVALTLLIETIAKRDGVEVSDAELDTHLERVAERSRQPLAQLKALYANGNRIEELKMNLRHEKVVDSLMEKSNMSTAEAKADGAAETDEAPESEA